MSRQRRRRGGSPFLWKWLMWPFRYLLWKAVFRPVMRIFS